MSEKSLKKSISLKIQHLSENQIEELYSRYMNGEKNSVLIEEYSIDVNPSALINIFPPIVHDDKICPYCRIPMISKRKSKSSYSGDTPPINCTICGHHEYSDESRYYWNKECNCNQCRQLKKSQEEEKQSQIKRIIHEEYSITNQQVYLYSNMSFSDKVLLFTLLRLQTEESFGYIKALDEPKTALFCPTREMDIEVLQSLFKKRIILVNPDSQIDAFKPDENYKSFFVNKVQWLPNVSIKGELRSDLSEIYNQLYDELFDSIQNGWSKDIRELIFRIAREEVLQYLYMRTDELRVSFSAENKTREIVRKLLEDFSVSELYYFVKKAVENAHIFYSKGHAKNKRHAANTIPNKMMSLGERALNEGWDPYQYGRDSRSPRSAASEVLFDFVLKDEDSGFSKSPGKHWLELQLNVFTAFGSKSSPNDDMKCLFCGSKNIHTTFSHSVVLMSCHDCGRHKEFTDSSEET